MASLSTVAITRELSTSFESCELTHQARERIDLELAVEQHRGYERALAELGCRLVTLPGDADLPDCVFVEDVAVVLDEVAVITRPGAVSRRPEIPVVRAALEPFKPVAAIRAPGTLDGGDVLAIGRTLHVGLSSRTNREGIEQLGRLVAEHGYRVRPVEFRSCLHLKSAVTRVDDRTLLIYPEWVSPDVFEGVDLIEVDPAEPHGANALPIGGVVLHASAYPLTRERLEHRGLSVRTVDLSELAKAEGAVTCCSLIVEVEKRE